MTYDWDPDSVPFNDRVYLAAIVDTHGAITMRTWRGYRFPMLRICGKREMLELLSARFGGLVTSVPSRPNYCWTKQGTEAVRVLELLRPMMRIRVREADELLAWKPTQPLKVNGPRARDARKAERAAV